jgi:4'-phosphopantetheinyl transferase
VPALAEDEVHVWCGALEGRADTSGLLPALSEEERERLGRFRSRQAGNQFAVGRGLLRALLGRYLGVPPHWLTFRQGPQGKPALADPDALFFNASHSHGLALYAVTRLAEVGVDVEQVRPFANDLALAQRFFCSAESRALAALPETARVEAFFRLWTCKEAYLKACGTGLAHGLERVEMGVSPAPPRILRIDGQEAPAARWSLEALTPVPGYVGALALEAHGYRLRCWAF